MRGSFWSYRFSNSSRRSMSLVRLARTDLIMPSVFSPQPVWPHRRCAGNRCSGTGCQIWLRESLLRLGLGSLSGKGAMSSKCLECRIHIASHEPPKRLVVKDEVPSLPRLGPQLFVAYGYQPACQIYSIRG